MNKLLSASIPASLFLLSTIMAPSLAVANDGIVIVQDTAWARATPPGSKTTAIYLTLMNHTDTDTSLTGVTADISDQVELHTHTNDNGMMKMQQVSSITVSAGGQTALKPHGDHIMAFNLQEQLKAGDEISAELTFNDGTTKILTIPVHKESPTSSDDSMNHDGMQPDAEHMKNKDADDAHQHEKAS